VWINFVAGCNYVYCSYHPPKPCYRSTALLDMLCAHINDIFSSDSNAVIILAGDFNKLDCYRLEIDNELTQVVDQVTLCKSLLDKCFTNCLNVLLFN